MIKVNMQIFFLSLLAFLILFSCSKGANTTHSSYESCLKKVDTLSMNHLETIGCTGDLIYQFLNDSTVVTIKLTNRLLFEERNCVQFDLLKDSLFVGIYLYSFINLNAASIIQMPICTDIIVENASKPIIERLHIKSGDLRLFRNSTCKWSLLMNANVMSKIHKEIDHIVISSWATDICDFPG
ncbi:MAG: hypothetical protein AB8G15_03685 [Saprospiraceae bacterium]